jgi:quercetin dioxygenase-like cupin family protein
MREAEIEHTSDGAVPAPDGWFIQNLAELVWESAPRFGAWRDLIPGAHVHVLSAGEAPGYYHAEEAAEGFLVLSGECVALVEGEERRMRQWDYLHSPPGTAHITVGAGDEPCALLMFGSPDPSRRIEWIADEAAARHGASVAETTSDWREAYRDAPPPKRVGPPRPFTR